MEEKPWKIEKTNFPFLDVHQKPLTWKMNFYCISDNSMDFHLFLYTNSFYGVQPSYSYSLQTSKRELVCFESFGTADYDLLKKNASLTAEPFLAIVRYQDCLWDIYLSMFPKMFKSTPAITHQFVIVHLKRDESTDATEEQIKTAAEFVGATHIVTIDRRSRPKEKTIEEFCEAIATQIPAKISLKDRSISKRFHMLALIVSSDLSTVKKQIDMLDPNFVDPLGNNLLHYAVRRADQEMFFYIAMEFPDLINKPNSKNSTPIHEFINFHFNNMDWDRLWKLPIKFSRKNNNGNTCLTQIQYNQFGFKAFEALIKNEAAWTKARKHHKRKVILTKVVHKMLEDWKDDDKKLQNQLNEKIQFFVNNGASIHFHEQKSLINTAIKHQRIKSIIKLLELGSKLREEDILACWDTGNEEMIRWMIDRPEMNLLSQNNLNHIAKETVSFGLTDVLRALVKKGCKVDLSANESAQIVTGNLIAQMHCNSIIIPLKFQCVDVIYESVKQQNKERNNNKKKNSDHSDDEAESIDWDQELKGYPDEIRHLFPRKELWRWALFLKDEKKQSQILKLYQAINRAVKSQKSKENHAIELIYGPVKFCFSFNGPNQLIWLGDLKSNSPKHRMYYEEFSETTGGGYIDWSYKTDETNKEILEQVMKTCGWDPEDSYVFLHILHTSFIREDTYIDPCFFTSFVYEFLKPPQWYNDFVKQTYGLEHPDRPMNSYRDY